MFVLFIIHITKKEKNEINVKQTFQACYSCQHKSADTAALLEGIFRKIQEFLEALHTSRLL